MVRTGILNRKARIVMSNDGTEPVRHDSIIHGGFTLIELMIVVAIVALLAAIGYPAYTDQVRKARRADAQAELNDAASREEQFFLDNKTYTTSFGNTGLNISTTTEGGYYTLSATMAGGGYVLTATPQGAQASDPCGALTLNSSGVRGAAKSDCW